MEPLGQRIMGSKGGGLSMGSGLIGLHMKFVLEVLQELANPGRGGPSSVSKVPEVQAPNPENNKA